MDEQITMKWLLFVVVLCLVPLVSAVELQLQPNQTADTNQSYEYILRYRGDKNVTSDVVFFIVGNSSVVFNGRRGGYHDSFTLSNNIWDEEDVKVTFYYPGAYTLKWGLNYSNGSLYQQTFKVVVTGNGTPIGKDVAVNESDYYADKYGRIDDKYLPGTISDLRGSTQHNNTQEHNDTPKGIENNTMNISTLPLANVESQREEQPPIINPVPAEDEQLPQLSNKGAIIALSIIGVVVAGGVGLAIFWLRNEGE